MDESTTRREFLKETALIGAAVAAMRAADGLDAAETGDDKMPTIKLGGLEVSRMILGSNPFFGFAHKPGDVGRKMREYYTGERVMAVMDEAAERGVTAVWTPCYPDWIRLWKKYRQRGGKLKVWIGQPDRYEQMKEHITACAKNGGKAICIQGESIDRAFARERYDLVREWLELIRSFKLPAGMASHRPTTHLLAEKKKLPTDFYHQCVYQPENYSKRCRDLAVETIKKLDKPVVAYKVLAAGRLAAKTALTHIFGHLRAKDGICVGIWPPQKPDQLQEDTALTRTLSKAKLA